MRAHLDTTALRGKLKHSESKQKLRHGWLKGFIDAQMIPLLPAMHLPLHSKKKENSPVSMQIPTILESKALSEQVASNIEEIPTRPSQKRSISQCSSTAEILPPVSQRGRQIPERDGIVRERTAEESTHSPDSAHSNRPQRRKVGVQFTEVAAHTAKCDECNRRNQGGMSRCKNCGWQICRKCKNDRAGDQSHASFGATHVPEVGGDVPLDGTHDKQTSCESPALEAAQTLIELADNIIPAQNDGRDGRKDNYLHMGVLGDEKLDEEADDVSIDSDVTMSMVGDDEGRENDTEMVVDDGLLIGYLIARRNPTRAARPSCKMTE